MTYGDQDPERIAHAILQEARRGASVPELRAAAAAIAPRMTASDLDSTVASLAASKLLRKRRGRWWATTAALERLDRLEA